MNTLLLASTEESTGKTALALGLAQLAKERGDSVGYMKPIGTRLQSNVGKTIDADPMLAREILDIDAPLHEMEPIVYSPTFVEGAIRGKEDGEALRDTVSEAFETLSKGNDRMFVEGGGAYTTGGIVDLAGDDVAKLLDADVVLVERVETVEDIDDVLAATKRFGSRVEGVVFNAVGDSMYDAVESDVVPFLQSRDISVHGVIPHDRALAGVALADITDELGGEVYTSVDDDVFVERVVVGAMTGESALRHFRRTKDAVVVTGGDRSDVQSAALDAPGIKAIVLTGGFEPAGAILGKAAERNVPVLVVQSDTLSAVERIEDLISGGRIREASTVEKMRRLLTEHVDVDVLLE